MASFKRSIWSRYSSRSFCASCKSLTAASNRCSSFARSLFAEASPSASIRKFKSENLRRNNSASAFDSARLVVNVLTDSCWIDNCRRNSSFCASIASAVTACSAFSILDSDKELFPCACTAPAVSKHSPIADFRFKISDLKEWRLRRDRFNLQSAIFNLKFLLGHLRRVRPVLFKQTRRRKFAELMSDHVLGDEHGMKCLSVVHQK